MMELGLSLGDNHSSRPNNIPESSNSSNQLGLGFDTTLSIGPIITVQTHHHHQEHEEPKPEKKKKEDNNRSTTNNNNGFQQLDLLPKLSFSWPPFISKRGSISIRARGKFSRVLDVNLLPTATAAEEEAEEGAALSSSPSASSFQMDLCIYSRGSGGSGKRDHSDGEAYYEQSWQRGSDNEDDNGATRKKLRLSKEQSAFLEESFKEHHTLNPKQKVGLAKQLNLRPRQVEVWFQNRRARTKLKQTEVDCEYLKKCCETLTEENRRLHKELQELRALKNTTNSNPFYMQFPATTLTMCPSCERVVSNSNSKPIGFPFDAFRHNTTTTTTQTQQSTTPSSFINATN